MSSFALDWFAIVIIAYMLNAGAMIIDKSLLKKSIPEPIVYTFYIGLLGLVFVPLLMPFGFTVPARQIIIYSLLSGIFFISALLIFFKALKGDDASQVIPLIGGLNPLAILIFAYFIVGERLSLNQIIALIFIMAGTYVISLDRKKTGKLKISSQTLKLGVASALFFGLSYVLSKVVYNEISFISGFIWTRIGALMAVFSLLLFAKYRKQIFGNTIKVHNKVKVIFIIGQAFGGISFLMVNYAISLGSVTLTNAMQGLQYVFLFLIIIFLTKKYPHIIHEKINREVIFLKILAIILISVGLIFIAM